jgi:hypothetical protein
MMRPPFLATLLVRVSCPARELPFVLGDLEAEYAVRGGRRWYWWQAARSAWWMAAAGLRPYDWELSALAVLLASAAPALLLDAWWRFVLSHVPLKADPGSCADIAGLSLGLTAVLSVCAGAACTVRGLILAVPAAWVFAILGQAGARGALPMWFCAATLIVVALALTAGAWARRIFFKPSSGRFA